jgi:hypothetical protein
VEAAHGVEAEAAPGPAWRRLRLRVGARGRRVRACDLFFLFLFFIKKSLSRACDLVRVGREGNGLQLFEPWALRFYG